MPSNARRPLGIRDAGMVHRRKPARPCRRSHGKSQSAAWEQRRIVLRLRRARHDSWIESRAIPTRFSVRQARSRSGRETRTRPFQGPRLLVLRASYNSLTQHLHGGRVWNRRGFIAAKESGDLTFAAFSSSNMVANLLAAGDLLGEVAHEADSALDFARKMRFELVSDFITGQLRLIKTLRGLTPRFGCFNDAEFDESQFEQHLEGNPRLAIAACKYWIRKLQARFYADDYRSAVAAASKAQLHLRRSQSFLEFAEYPFYSALAHAAFHTSAPADEKARHLAAVTVHYKQIEVWAQNCPENFGTYAALVAGEISRVEGRELDAERQYERAIQLSR